MTRIFFIIFLTNILFSNSNLFLSTFELIFENISIDDLNNGYKDLNIQNFNQLNINVQSNNTFNIYIYAEDIYVQSKLHKIPIKKFKWKHSNKSESNYQPLSIERMIINEIDYNRGNINLDFRLELDWFTPPGNYSLPITLLVEEVNSQNTNFRNKKKKTRKSKTLNVKTN